MMEVIASGQSITKVKERNKDIRFNTIQRLVHWNQEKGLVALKIGSGRGKNLNLRDKNK